MACVVRYSFLFISICLRSILCAEPELKAVEFLTGDVGKEITIQCATDKIPQGGVYMYKKGANEKQHQVFYFYNGKITPKAEKYKDKVSVGGKFPQLNATFSDLNTPDSGVYWCEFNFEEKVTFGTVTGLNIKSMEDTHDKSKDDKKDTEAETEIKAETQKKCPENPLVKIVLTVCAVLSLLCMIGFIFVILKVKERKKNSPSNEPSDSVYEEMKRSVPSSVKMFINPDYQTTKLLC